MPSRNRTSVSDVPIYAMMAMISDPKKYGKMIEEFSRAETSAKNAETVARARENAAGDAEKLVHEREQVVAQIEDAQAQENGRLAGEGERLSNGVRDLGEKRAAFEVERRQLATDQMAFEQSRAGLLAQAQALVSAA